MVRAAIFRGYPTARPAHFLPLGNRAVFHPFGRNTMDDGRAFCAIWWKKSKKWLFILQKKHYPMIRRPQFPFFWVENVCMDSSDGLVPAPESVRIRQLDDIRIRFSSDPEE
jgi:hypothetical protein